MEKRESGKATCTLCTLHVRPPNLMDLGKVPPRGLYSGLLVDSVHLNTIIPFTKCGLDSMQNDLA